MGVERLAGEVVAEIMSVIEAVALPPDVDDDAEDLRVLHEVSRSLQRRDRRLA